MMMDVLKILM